MDKELLDAGYRAYTGEKIDVYFNTAICQHSGNCVRGSAKLFNLKRKPWIIPDELFRCARLPNMNLIKPASTTISAPDHLMCTGRYNSHPVHHSRCSRS